MKHPSELQSFCFRLRRFFCHSVTPDTRSWLAALRL